MSRRLFSLLVSFILSLRLLFAFSSLLVAFLSLLFAFSSLQRIQRTINSLPCPVTPIGDTLRRDRHGEHSSCIGIGERSVITPPQLEQGRRIYATTPLGTALTKEGDGGDERRLLKVEPEEWVLGGVGYEFELCAPRCFAVCEPRRDLGVMGGDGRCRGHETEGRRDGGRKGGDRGMEK